MEWLGVVADAEVAKPCGNDIAVLARKKITQGGVLVLHFQCRSVAFTYCVSLQFELCERRSITYISTHISTQSGSVCGAAKTDSQRELICVRMV